MPKSHQLTTHIQFSSTDLWISCRSSAPGYRFGSGLLIYPHLPTQAEEAAASWIVLVFLQVRVAKSLAILSKSPHYIYAMLTHILFTQSKSQGQVQYPQGDKHIPPMQVREQVNICFPLIIIYQNHILQALCAIPIMQKFTNFEKMF